MDTALDKARGALTRAAKIPKEDLNDEVTTTAERKAAARRDYGSLLDIANIQANVAAAEAGVASAAALERIADRLEQLEWMKVGNVEKTPTVLYRGRPIGHVDDPDHGFEDGSTEYGSGVWEPTKVSR